MADVDLVMKAQISFVDYSQMLNWSVRYLIENNFDYNNKYTLFNIGDFLQRNRNTITIEDDTLYSRVTIKLYNKGVHKRNEAYGKEIGTKKQYLIKPGQFILSKIDARNGAFGIVPESLDGAITTADFLSYDIDANKINPYFLKLLTSTNQFLAYCQGASSGTTGRQRINEQSFLNAKIPLPSLEVQNQIAEAYNQKIQFAEQQEQQAKQLKQDIENYLFDVLGLNRRKEKEKINGLQLISYSTLILWDVNSETFKLNEIFSSTKYPLVTLSECSQIGSGGTPLRGRKDYYTGNIPWVKTGEVRENIIVDTQEKITEEALQNSSAKVYPQGSLIIAMYGATAGRTALLGIDAATNQACAVLHNIDSKKLNTSFLRYYLESQTDNFQSIASGSAQPNLNAKKISTYKIPLPPLKVQVKIADTIEKMKYKISMLQQQTEENRTVAIEVFEKAIFL